MRLTPCRFAGLLMAALLATSAGQARAQYYPGGINDMGARHAEPDLSVMAWVPWWYGFGLGLELRYEIPILPQGFIPTINDEFSLEPSLGLAYTWYGDLGYNYNFEDITPALYGIWSFWLSRPFRLYTGLGLGVNIGVYSGPNGGVINPTYFYWDVILGLGYHIANNVALRAEVGVQGFKGGVSFFF